MWRPHHLNSFVWQSYSVHKWLQRAGNGHNVVCPKTACYLFCYLECIMTTENEATLFLLVHRVESSVLICSIMRDIRNCCQVRLLYSDCTTSCASGYKQTAIKCVRCQIEEKKKITETNVNKRKRFFFSSILEFDQRLMGSIDRYRIYTHTFTQCSLK